jgi:hypothetical protein
LDRASTFADPIVIHKLQKDFIPFAGDISEYAWRRTEASRWFMQHGGMVNYKIRSADSVQGFYTMGADGTAYGFSNVRGAKTVNGLLTDAFNRFYANRPPKVEIKVDKPKQFANSPEPASTDVVRVFTRVRPVPLAANSLNKGVGRDHLWVLGSDLKQIAAAGASGSAFQMPESLRMRIARFHLLDNVRGQPDPWQISEVKKASIRVTPVGRSGPDMVYKLDGSFAMRTSDGKRGLEGTLKGELEVDVAKNRVTWLRVISDATAWGESKFTAHGPVGKYPLIIAMLNVDDTLAREIEPDSVSLGQQYFLPTSVKKTP